MALTWKKITTDDNVPNIGNSDLTVSPDGVSRSLNFGSGNLQIRNSTNQIGLSLASITTQVGNTQGTFLNQLYTAGTTFYLNPIAAQIFSSGVNNFIIESTADSAVAGPILNLIRNPITPGGTDNDEIGRINFQGDNESGVGHSYADITAKIIDSDDTNKNCDLTFRVQDKDVQQSNLIITSAASSSTSLTENEGLLHALKIQTKTLEELTRRTQMVYQCGYNGIITSPTSTSASTEQMLRVSNGVQVIDGGNYASSTGIVMPFDGYIAGGSFSCVRSDSSGTYADDGDILFRIQKYTPDGAGQWDLLVGTASATTATNPVSTTYSISTVRSTGVTVAKGDILLPHVKIQTNESGTAYRIDDLIAQFVVYSEEVDQT